MSGPGLVYLASPYSSRSPVKREVRAYQAARTVARALARGECMVSPVVHGHAILHTQPDLGGTWDTWRALDLALLARCTELRVLRLPGWEKSKGIQGELAEARRLGLPITYAEYRP